MKVLGITDSVNICDCCGKSGLERTVGIELNNGDIVYYGTTCATKKHGVSTGLKTLVKISQMVKASRNMRDFLAFTKRYGFGNAKVLSPIYDNVDCVTWLWEDVKITSKQWVTKGGL